MDLDVCNKVVLFDCLCVGQVAPTIKQRMMLLGTMLVGYQPDGELVNFFRMVISNTSTSTDDMDFVVTEISRLGSDL